MIRLTVPDPPVGKQRPYVCRSGHAFNRPKTVNYEALVKQTFAAKYPDFVPMQGPLLMHVKAFFAIPKTTSKKRRAEMESERVWYPHRIDGDNLWKIIADALNGLAYVDDGQLADGRVLKHYSPRPRIEIEVEELP